MKAISKPSPHFFKNSDNLRSWFIKNHDCEQELWIGFYKKGSGKEGVGYAEALNQALCFGWIDGIRKSIDAVSYTNRFTPRKRASKWSKINTSHVQRLIEAGLMMPAGLKEVDLAKKDGRWDQAYEPPRTTAAPEDFLKALAMNKEAKAFFDTLTKTNIFAITAKLEQTKKPETRQRWIARIIEMMANGEKFRL